MLILLIGNLKIERRQPEIKKNWEFIRYYTIFTRQGFVAKYPGGHPSGS